MASRIRNVISRGTLLAIAAALLYAGVFLVRTGIDYDKEWLRDEGFRTSWGSGHVPLLRSILENPGLYVLLAGGLVLLIGGIALVGTILPWQSLERFVEPPVSGERPGGPEHLGRDIWWLFSRCVRWW